MILYEWPGRDGKHYRMAAGVHAIYRMREGQRWELQVSTDREHWEPVEHLLGFR